jgi:hypothetical protein
VVEVQPGLHETVPVLVPGPFTVAVKTRVAGVVGLAGLTVTVVVVGLRTVTRV